MKTNYTHVDKLQQKIAEISFMKCTSKRECKKLLHFCCEREVQLVNIRPVLSSQMRNKQGRDFNRFQIKADRLKCMERQI
jgi:hypothetical protein